MNAAVSMLLCLMLFATFVTLGVLRRSIQRNNFYSSEPAIVMTKASLRRHFWKRLGTRQDWWRLGLTRKAFAMFSRKSTSGAAGIRSKQPSNGHSVKCA